MGSAVALRLSPFHFLGLNCFFSITHPGESFCFERDIHPLPLRLSLYRQRRTTAPPLQIAVAAAFRKMSDFLTTSGFAFLVLIPASLLGGFLSDPTSDVWVDNRMVFTGVWFLYNFLVGTSSTHSCLGTASYSKGWIPQSSVRTRTS